MWPTNFRYEIKSVYERIINYFNTHIILSCSRFHAAASRTWSFIVLFENCLPSLWCFRLTSHKPITRIIFIANTTCLYFFRTFWTEKSYHNIFCNVFDSWENATSAWIVVVLQNMYNIANFMFTITHFIVWCF